jgi:hypothetical protein
LISSARLLKGFFPVESSRICIRIKNRILPLQDSSQRKISLPFSCCQYLQKFSWAI